MQLFFILVNQQALQCLKSLPRFWGHSQVSGTVLIGLKLDFVCVLSNVISHALKWRISIAYKQQSKCQLPLWVAQTHPGTPTAMPHHTTTGLVNIFDSNAHMSTLMAPHCGSLGGASCGNYFFQAKNQKASQREIEREKVVTKYGCAHLQCCLAPLNKKSCTSIALFLFANCFKHNIHVMLIYSFFRFDSDSSNIFLRFNQPLKFNLCVFKGLTLSGRSLSRCKSSLSATASVGQKQGAVPSLQVLITLSGCQLSAVQWGSPLKVNNNMVDMVFVCLSVQFCCGNDLIVCIQLNEFSHSTICPNFCAHKQFCINQGLNQCNFQSLYLLHIQAVFFLFLPSYISQAHSRK